MRYPPLDVGNRTGTLLVFGGPYSNLQALAALRHYAQQLKIPPENCICTGDIVAYCAQPKETIELFTAWGARSVMGNCEESLASDSSDCGCGFAEGSSCDVLSAQWFQFAKTQLDEADKAWCGALPRCLTFCLDGVDMLVVHGSISAINQFVFESTADELLRPQVTQTNAQVVLAGHSGIPFTKQIGTTIWHNAGAIGMPANDGTPRTWFSVIRVEQGQITIESRELHYDYQQARVMMHQRGLSHEYADALVDGMWPSTDILPSSEKSHSGHALHPHTIATALGNE